ncbi:MAG: hypothetical protein Q9182_001265 [Xanthomendoza sp. 2 TL-2023]
MSEPEIFVHSAAPSHGSDDVRYRKEAHAIIRFEAVRKHHILPEPQPPHRSGANGTRQISRQQTSQQSVAQAQDSVISIDPAPRQHLTDALSTWITPPLSRPSSRILVGQTPAPCLLTRASGLISHLLVEQTPTNQQRPSTAPAGPSIIQETPPLRRSFSNAFETPPSEIPDSQPASHKNHQQHDEATFEASSSPSPTRAEEPPAKRRKGDDGAGGLLGEGTPPDDTSTPPLKDGPPVSSAPSNEHTHPTTSSPTAPRKSESTMLAYRRRKIDPPPPEPSLRTTVPSHCTSSLQILRQQCPAILETVKPLRPLHNLERGYWRLTFPLDLDEEEDAPDKTRWTRSSCERMWEYLVQFIGHGRGGWGIWATFEEGNEERFDGEKGWIGEMGEQEVVADGPVRGRVKVFCYGEVVREVYALLVVATDRRVKRCGAQWVDGYREVVVEV